MKLLLQSLPFLLFALGCHYANASIIKRVPVDSSVQGVIMDQATNKPVSNVSISLCSKQGCKEIKSDASGFFAFSQLVPGEFTLVIEKDGYKSFKKAVLVPREGMVFKLSLEEDDEEGDTWNPFRVLFDK